MFLLSEQIKFPPVHLANKTGLLAVGGDLSSERLIEAYKKGIFPWYSEGEPICWYSPNPRMVLFPNKIHISKSMKKVLKNENFEVTFNQNFERVIENCKNSKRKNQFGTWITNEMEKAYIKLHKKGVAKSVEVWKNNRLVGGLYGIDLQNVFCGESMFSKVSNASKVAFVYLAEKLYSEKYKIIDCQIYNDHLASMGAEEISREKFLTYLT